MAALGGWLLTPRSTVCSYARHDHLSIQCKDFLPTQVRQSSETISSLEKRGIIVILHVFQKAHSVAYSKMKIAAENIAFRGKLWNIETYTITSKNNTHNWWMQIQMLSPYRVWNPYTHLLCRGASQAWQSFFACFPHAAQRRRFGRSSRKCPGPLKRVTS